MSKRILSLTTAFIAAFLFSISCNAYIGNAAKDDYSDFDDDYNQDVQPEEPIQNIDYDPDWDMDFTYLGTFHDKDSGFTAEMFQGGAIIMSYDKNDIHVTVPEKMGDKTVIAIREYAFQGNHTITDVKLPHGLKYIGESAFGNCVNLRKVNFSDTLFSIGKGAFFKCSLESVELPDSLYSIGMEAFWQCQSLNSVTFSDSIERICSFAFKESGIESAQLPKKLQYLGKGAFESCTNLESVDCGACPIILNNTFYECKNLKTVTFAEGLIGVKHDAFYNCGLTGLEFPEGLIEIGNRAFMDCKMLKEVKFPQSLQNIGESAFEGCESLNEVHLTDNVTEMGQSVFSKCSSLENVSLSESLKTIPNSAFSYCSSLKTIVIPKNVKDIGYEAFAWCESLEEIYIPDSVTHINRNAFLMEDTSKITIKGDYDSAARRFAERNDINFKVDADENQQKVMLTVIISVWALVLAACFVLLIRVGKNKKIGKEN